MKSCTGFSLFKTRHSSKRCYRRQKAIFYTQSGLKRVSSADVPIDDLRQVCSVTSTSMVCLEKVNSFSLSCRIAVQAISLEGKEDFCHHIPMPVSHIATHDNCQVMSVMETNTLQPSRFLAAGLLLAPAAIAALHQSFLRQIGSQDLVLFRGEENMEQF